MKSCALTDDLRLLTAALPDELRLAVERLPADELLEIVLDLGRLPQARLVGRCALLSQEPVSAEQIDGVVAAVGSFGPDNRAGIEGTLHRISAIRNRGGRIIGLTLRVGRAVMGTIEPIRDLIRQGVSVLLLGAPGVGKTTKLREVARVLADEVGKRVIVVDTSNEIAGDGDVPHPAIGGARRMQVAHPDRQHGVMIEAVENHMPEAIIIDEIGTEAEALAARTIAERGVQLVGTAHGNTLENLVQNPTLCDLVGGVQTVILGDDEARLRGTQKSVNERRGPPTFGAVVEIVDRETVIVHPDAGRAVDLLLRGVDPRGEQRGGGGGVNTSREAEEEEPWAADEGRDLFSGDRTLRIHAYAITPDFVERAIRDLDLPARVVRHPEQADLIIALRARSADPRLLRAVDLSGAAIHGVKKNSASRVRQLLRNLLTASQEPNFEIID